MRNAAREELIDGGWIAMDRYFLTKEHAEHLFSVLLQELPWEQGTIVLFGKKISEPRLSCWIGEPGASYRYSGVTRKPSPWTQHLQEIRRCVEVALETSFNSVLANLYRDGSDSMGMHADDEPELGIDPVIASLSLGSVRRFRLCSPSDRRSYELESGSLLVMGGATQSRYKHGISKTRRSVGPRINLTFRCIVRE